MTTKEFASYFAFKTRRLPAARTLVVALWDRGSTRRQIVVVADDDMRVVDAVDVLDGEERKSARRH
jgi:hypothetical protein